MLILMAAAVALGIGGAAAWIDESIIAEHCTYIENREILNPWGGGDHAVYDCGGTEVTMPANLSKDSPK